MVWKRKQFREASEKEVDLPKDAPPETLQRRRKSTAAPPPEGTQDTSSQANPFTQRRRANREGKKEGDRSHYQSSDLTPDRNPHLSTRPKKPLIHSSALLLQRSKSDAPDLVRAEAQGIRATEKGSREEEGEERRREKDKQRGGAPTTMAEKKSRRQP
ncbi:unnamed protein product [Brassica rapa]|uniref:Uncharacterized protein n=1 Tax=Brassica campestris TaxID=3711 RepID=A0A8D9HCH2_BRACM|nr:unnamed protein product [Brassica rapa]